MAYQTNNTITELDDILLNKRGSEVLRVSRYENSDTHEISYDVRRWYTDDNDEFKPTAKGVRCKADVMAEVIKTICSDMRELGINVDDGSDVVMDSMAVKTGEQQ